jgi:hypothetical protein
MFDSAILTMGNGIATPAQQRCVRSRFSKSLFLD